MHASLPGLLLLASRVLQLNQTPAPQGVMEMATNVRSVGEIREAKADPEARTLTLSGEEWQMALADWLTSQLDRAPPAARGGAVARYQITGAPSDLAVGVAFPARADTPQTLQELTTMARSVLELRRAFTFTPTRALVMRGSAAELEATEWLLQELDRDPPRGLSDVHVLRGDPEGTVRVFWMKPVLSVQQFLTFSSEMRKELGIRRLFTFNATRAVAIRGTPEQVAAAEKWYTSRQLLRNSE